MGTVPAPAQGLGSNRNYFIGNPGEDTAGAPIRNLTVVIQIDENMQSIADFDFQLNAYPPPQLQDNNSNWQQYVVNFDTSNPGAPFVGCSVEYLGSTPFNTPVQSVLEVPVSNPQTLPAGYVLTISLTTDPDTGDVTNVSITATAPAALMLPPATPFSLDIATARSSRSLSLT